MVCKKSLLNIYIYIQNSHTKFHNNLTYTFGFFRRVIWSLLGPKKYATNFVILNIKQCISKLTFFKGVVK